MGGRGLRGGVPLTLGPESCFLGCGLRSWGKSEGVNPPGFLQWLVMVDTGCGGRKLLRTREGCGGPLDVGLVCVQPPAALHSPVSCFPQLDCWIFLAPRAPTQGAEPAAAGERPGRACVS